MTLAEAADLMGITESALAELVVEAGVTPPDGPPSGWLFEAADIAAVAAERDRRERLNRLELDKLSAALEDSDG